MVRIIFGSLLIGLYWLFVTTGIIQAGRGRTTLGQVALGALIMGGILLLPGVLFVYFGNRSRRRNRELALRHPEFTAVKRLVGRRVLILGVAELGAALIGFVVGPMISDSPFAGIGAAGVAAIVVAMLLIVPLSRV
jgi:hypothetical protein